MEALQREVEMLKAKKKNLNNDSNAASSVDSSYNAKNGVIFKTTKIVEESANKKTFESISASSGSGSDNPARPGSLLLSVPKDFVKQLEDVFGPLMPNDNLSTGPKIEINLAAAKSIYDILGSCIHTEKQVDLKKAGSKRKLVLNNSSGEKKMDQENSDAIGDIEEPISLSKIMKKEASAELSKKDKAIGDWDRITPEAQIFRQKAAEHYELERLCKDNLQKFRDMKIDIAADAYAADACEHRLKMDAANKVASDLILRHNNKGLDCNDLDLHGLFTGEAVTAVSKFLDAKQNSKRCKIITGQGHHSLDGPKIRPAVINFLKNNNYNFSDDNPGFVMVYLHSHGNNAPRNVCFIGCQKGKCTRSYFEENTAESINLVFQFLKDMCSKNGPIGSGIAVLPGFQIL
ncbi:uncharacterized protein LOC129956505 [Argiope bruennichi]|uniref:uncharacterized protein LOC129956505 n=1 Tax=Argiope bruennichi TaxID=94029 RepID=UPI002493DA66|nr:uncharacterized protein LOC129956505 [Argiope bruennichi]